MKSRSPFPCIARVCQKQSGLKLLVSHEYEKSIRAQRSPSQCLFAKTPACMKYFSKSIGSTRIPTPSSAVPYPHQLIVIRQLHLFWLPLTVRRNHAAHHKGPVCGRPRTRIIGERLDHALEEGQAGEVGNVGWTGGVVAECFVAVVSGVG